MRRGRGELQVFTLSAIDLFAAALGAFIVMSVVLFPYYLNTIKLEREAQKIGGSIAQTTEEIKNAKAAFQASTKKLEEVKKADEKLKQMRERLKEVTRAIAEAEKREKQMTRELKEGSEFAFLGHKSKSKSFVILVETSLSIAEYKSDLIDTVDRVIHALNPNYKLAIIGFNIYDPSGPNLEAWPALDEVASMTKTKKAEARRFIRQLTSRFRGASPTQDALKAALANPAESILLITDDLPSWPQGISAASVISDITASNTTRKEIHTVAVGAPFATNRIFKSNKKRAEILNFLQVLASRNNGDFSAVARN